MIVTVLLLLILILLICDYYQHNGRNGRLINSIPGPRTLPILGNALEWQKSPEMMWELFYIHYKKYGRIFRVWFSFLPVVSIGHPNYIEIILSSTKHIEKSIVYTALHPWLGTGLLTSGGTKWHTRRKILTPTFHFNILQQFVGILTEEGQHMTTFLKDNKGPVVKDLVPLMSEYTLNAICETAMGTSLKDIKTFQQQYRQSVYEMGYTIIQRIFKPWLSFNWMFSLTSLGRMQKRNLKILHGFTNKIIAERKLFHERTEGRYLKIFENDGALKISDDNVMGIKKKRLAMLDLLIAAARENNITDEDIREEVDTFMFEGHDTVAMAMCFALLLLAEHKDIQDRVRVEINSIMQETGEELTMASLQSLTYLDRCLKESLRLYPSVPYISRVTTEDVKLDSHIVPAGIITFLRICHVHKDPNFWPNPDVFDPDRFLPEKIRNRHPYSYIPFSAEPRNCIGQRYAILEMKAMIAPLVYNFYLEPVDYLKDVKLKLDLVLRPAHPIRLKFVPIERT